VQTDPIFFTFVIALSILLLLIFSVLWDKRKRRAQIQASAFFNKEEVFVKSKGSKSGPNPSAQDIAAVSGEDVPSTKLDLATAYLNMGDKPRAKCLLDDVIKQGDPHQISEAKRLWEQC